MRMELLSTITAVRSDDVLCSGQWKSTALVRGVVMLMASSGLLKLLWVALVVMLQLEIVVLPCWGCGYIGTARYIPTAGHH